MARANTLLSQTVSDNEAVILDEWMQRLRQAGADQGGRINAAELQTQGRDFLSILKRTLGESSDVTGAAFEPLRELLADISRSRAIQGYSPRETALFVFSLKQALFAAVARRKDFSAEQLAQATWEASTMLDELGLHTMDVYQRSREEVIVRQQREIAELSTPVVKLWDGILALPLIGTLDSERTQVVMENLLQSIVDSGADFAIIDITGVPTVDTLTAQHLLKTIAAARLMGADCIISGIRPQIAQTMVHLGVELNVISKATLADAFALALKRLNKTVVTAKTPQAADSKAAG
ncbi:rsbT co-antagonist protein RsbR [Povalibacter uvarum]|uniref:RsbT co-antagonist protein RsbR n=1 Tax=Povalibacter uvarum TaxID=732238 RepID=A0A841HP85_9GAMM|nr:STAS domain-containing protein [Povalibacter uvarum]MBB6095121.1 rsbT co-antagonist protein RsbR [Povalibacter uvarum]